MWFYGEKKRGHQYAYFTVTLINHNACSFLSYARPARPCSSNNFVVADTDDYARVALPAAAAVAPSAAGAATEVGGLSEEESNNESGSDDMESVIESEQGVIV